MKRNKGETAKFRQLTWTMHYYDITLLQDRLWKERMQESTSLKQETTWQQSGSSGIDSRDHSEPRRMARYRPWRSHSR